MTPWSHNSQTRHSSSQSEHQQTSQNGHPEEQRLVLERRNRFGLFLDRRDQQRGADGPGSAILPISAAAQHPRTPPRPKLRRKVPISDTLNESTAVQRLVEYVVIVSSQPRWQQQRQKSESNTDNKSEAAGPGGDGGKKSSTSQEESQQQQQEEAEVDVSKGSTNGKSTGAKQQPSSNGTKQKPNDPTEDERRQPDSPLPTAKTVKPSSVDSNSSGNIYMPEQPNETTTNTTEPTFVPVITARYPETDHADNPLNPMILQFCYPTGDVIVARPEYEMPRVHHFVLTQGCGRKLYATCLTVMEEWCDDGSSSNSNNNEGDEPPRSVMTEDSGNGIELAVGNINNNKHGNDDDRPVRYIPKVLCLLSTWPYLTAFREYLSQLYRLASTTNVMHAPLERYILNICCEIPAPPPGAYEVQLSILDSTIRFWAPPAKLPIAYVALPHKILFECLDLDNLLTVWTALIVERRVLLLSSQYSVLTVCSEILCSLLFPLRWSHLYVPLLPRMLCPMLDAPVPYLCGIVRENWMHAQQFVSDETIVVDLDCNSVQFAANVQQLPLMPCRKWNKLQAALTETVGDVFWRARGLEDEYATMMLKKPHKRSLEELRQVTTGGSSNKNGAQWTEKLSTLDHAFNLAYTPESPNLQDTVHDSSPDQQTVWDKVQEAFLRFFVALLRDYRKHLDIPKAFETSPSRSPDVHANNGNNKRPSFDRVAFIAGQRVDNVPFVSEMCLTQHFDDFLTRRLYSPGEPDLVFFDQSIDAKLNRSKLKIKKVDTPFLQSAKAHKELTKLDAVPPNVEGLDMDDAKGNKPYVYKKLPETFDRSLFCDPRPIPKMISAEFDRQSILVSKLRARIIEEDELEEDADDLLEFYGGDYDPSPEVGAFTVFLFVYASLVGRDWQKYSQKRRNEEAMEESAGGPGESRDGAAPDCGCAGVGETLLLDEDDVQNTSLDCCGACPEQLALNSTLTYIKLGAEDAYNAYFRRPMEQAVKDFSLSFTAEEEKLPETDAGLVEYEEAREVAAAQLEVAFETLATMSLRGLSVDSDAYLSLMEACGRCGDTKRALKLIELMKKDGFVADSDVLSCLIAAFAHEDVGRDASTEMQVEDTETEKVDEDAYSRFLEKSFHGDIGEGAPLLPYSPGRESHTDGPIDDSSCSEWSSTRSSTGSSGLMDWMHNYHPFERQKKKKRKRRKKRKSKTTPNTLVTEFLSSHVALGESLMEVVYPDLKIDTNSDSCPHCSHSLMENDVVEGWKPCAFQDYTSECPQCRHRFVPRFEVTSSAVGFQGSQGPQTPLYCEFLSPWVLRKEFQKIIKAEGGIDRLLDPEWRNGTDIRATLFWNLMASCRRYKMPYSFLLQGSFQNRLILPRRPEEVDEVNTA